MRNGRKTRLARPGHLIGRFGRAEDGSFTLLTLFFLLCIVIAGGMTVDILRHDHERTHLQSVLDNAVLAAADLDQSLDPEQVVRSYFEKEGIAERLEWVKVESGLNTRSVSAQAKIDVDTMYMHAVGVDNLTGLTAGTAREDIRDVEISMVLDVSGSMGDNNKLTYLKTAAKNFVDSMLLDPEGREIKDEVSINIVPYSTQVNVGQEMLGRMNIAHRHNFSACAEFPAEDFANAGMSASTLYNQAAHFDAYQVPGSVGSQYPAGEYLTCRTDDESRAVFLSDSRSALHGKIDSLWARGNTSIEIGLKWGIGLLDPQMRPALSGLQATSEEFKARPYDYGQEGAMKVLIVMTDGANTLHHVMNPAYSGEDNMSDVWAYYYNGKWRISIGERERRNVDGDYYHYENYYIPEYDVWINEPWGGSNAWRLTWAQAWAVMNTNWHHWFGRAEQAGSRDDTRSKNGVYNWWQGETITEVNNVMKDERMASICNAIKAKDVIVFSISFNVAEQDSQLMKNCATTPNHYFNVTGSQINYAFASIATTINQLQLVQ